MNSRVKFVPVLLLLMVTGNPDLLFAAIGHVKFEVVGQSSCTRETLSGATTLQIGQQCTAGAQVITISPNPNATLDMDGTGDAYQDAWRMPYTVSITANTTINNLHLTFLREHGPGPTSTYFKTWVKGGVNNGSGSIKVIGSVRKVSDGTTLTLDPVEASAANGSSFESSSVKQWTAGSLIGNREVKVDLEIVHLDNGATLDLALGGGGYVKLRSQPSADNVDPPVVCKELNWFLTTTCVTIHKLGYPRNIVASAGTDERVARAHQFARHNWESLSQDIAQGTGEHLASFATLLGIPSEHYSTLFAFAQDQYRSHNLGDTISPEEMVPWVQAALVSYPPLAELAPGQKR